MQSCHNVITNLYLNCIFTVSKREYVRVCYHLNLFSLQLKIDKDEWNDSPDRQILEMGGVQTEHAER